MNDTATCLSVPDGEIATEEGFRMFYERMQPAVFRLCRFQTGDPQTAQDLCQETFARAFCARASLRDAAGGRAWVLRIALNMCRSHARRRRLATFLRSLLPWTDDAIARAADTAPGPEATAQIRQRESQVRAALDALPQREREALGLVALNGSTYPEAAAALECSEESVRQAVSRGRRKLRQTLGEPEEAREGVARASGGVR